MKPFGHVLLVTDDPDSGGVAQYNHALLCALASRGYRATCVQSRADNPLTRRQAALGVRHHWLDFHTGVDFGRTLENPDDARGAFAACPPDLVLFSNSCPVSNFAARRAAVEAGLPFVVVENFAEPAMASRFAGTFTPTHGLLFRGWLRWGPLVLVCAAAAAGVALKTIFFSGLAEWVGLSFYLVLGWLGAFSGFLLWRRYGFAVVRPLLLGGVAYSVGAVMEFHGWPVLVPAVVRGHEVFHLAVLVGAVFHWLFVWQFASGEVRRRDVREARAVESDLLGESGPASEG